MSAAKKLRALALTDEALHTPEFDRALDVVMDALPLIADVVDAAEAECSPKERTPDKGVEYWASQPDHPIPGVQRRIDLARAVYALQQHLDAP